MPRKTKKKKPVAYGPQPLWYPQVYKCNITPIPGLGYDFVAGEWVANDSR